MRWDFGEPRSFNWVWLIRYQNKPDKMMQRIITPHQRGIRQRVTAAPSSHNKPNWSKSRRICQGQFHFETVIREDDMKRTKKWGNLNLKRLSQKSSGNFSRTPNKKIVIPLLVQIPNGGTFFHGFRGWLIAWNSQLLLIRHCRGADVEDRIQKHQRQNLKKNNLGKIWNFHWIFQTIAFAYELDLHSGLSNIRKECGTP